jgi:hypothetical protein
VGNFDGDFDLSAGKCEQQSAVYLNNGNGTWDISTLATMGVICDFLREIYAILTQLLQSCPSELW